MGTTCIGPSDLAPWKIANFFCHAKLDRYRGMADIEHALTPFNWAKATA
jgi:hypothetical protein